MKAKDLINLLFKVEESKEIQNSLFYAQYGSISKFFEEYNRNVFKQRLEESLNDKYKQSLNCDLFNQSQRIAIKSILNVICIENNLNVNNVINE